MYDFRHQYERPSCKSRGGSVAFRARCPLVQWQDIGLWIREWWFESPGGNALVPPPSPRAPPQGSPMDGLAVPSPGPKLFSGPANRVLADQIAHPLGVELCRVNLGRFA